MLQTSAQHHSYNHVRSFQSTTDIISPATLCPGCGGMKHPKGDGTYYDYCSKRCRDAYQSQPHLSLGSELMEWVEGKL